MNDGDALRRAILDHPDEDTPRLIYADWLEENRDPERAAFIRAQIEYSRSEPHSSQARAARDRFVALAPKNLEKWARGIEDLVTDWQFERGFISNVTAEPVELVRNADALFDSEPVQGLRLFRPVLPADGFGSENLWVPFLPLFDLPRLRQLRSLAFATGTELIHDEYEALVRCPHLAGVRDLALRGCPIQPAWLSEVLGDGAFPDLTGLGLAELPHIGRGLLTASARADHRRLRRLDVSGVVFTSEQLKHLLQRRCLRSVEELRLGCEPRGAGDFGPLFHLNLGWVIPWDRLVLLDLAGQQIGDENLREIANTREAAGLRWLGLANNGLDSATVRLLLDSKHLNLYHLGVQGNGLTPADLTRLRQRFPNAEVLG